MNKPLYLYAFRAQSSGGMEWVKEREVTEETMNYWFDIFQEDEPDVVFSVGVCPPKARPGQWNKVKV